MPLSFGPRLCVCVFGGSRSPGRGVAGVTSVVLLRPCSRHRVARQSDHRRSCNDCEVEVNLPSLRKGTNNESCSYGFGRFRAGFRPNWAPRPVPTGRARKMVLNAPKISPGAKTQYKTCCCVFFALRRLTRRPPQGEKHKTFELLTHQLSKQHHATSSYPEGTVAAGRSLRI